MGLAAGGNINQKSTYLTLLTGHADSECGRVSRPLSPGLIFHGREGFLHAPKTVGLLQRLASLFARQ